MRIPPPFVIMGSGPRRCPPLCRVRPGCPPPASAPDRKSTRLNSSHLVISYAVFCLKKKKGLLCGQFVDEVTEGAHGEAPVSGERLHREVRDGVDLRDNPIGRAPADARCHGTIGGCV